MLQCLQQHIRNVIDLSEIASMSSTALFQQAGIQRIRRRLEKKEFERERFQSLLCSLYENLTDGVISQGEYREFKRNYTQRRSEVEKQAEAIRDELDRELSKDTNQKRWMEQFQQHKNITEIDRALIVTLIASIKIYREHRVEIVFRWQNEY